MRAFPTIPTGFHHALLAHPLHPSPLPSTPSKSQQHRPQLHLQYHRPPLLLLAHLRHLHLLVLQFMLMFNRLVQPPSLNRPSYQVHNLSPLSPTLNPNHPPNQPPLPTLATGAFQQPLTISLICQPLQLHLQRLLSYSSVHLFHQRQRPPSLFSVHPCHLHLFVLQFVLMLILLTHPPYFVYCSHQLLSLLPHTSLIMQPHQRSMSLLNHPSRRYKSPLRQLTFPYSLQRPFTHVFMFNLPIPCHQLISRLHFLQLGIRSTTQSPMALHCPSQQRPLQQDHAAAVPNQLTNLLLMCLQQPIQHVVVVLSDPQTDSCSGQLTPPSVQLTSPAVAVE